MYFAGVEGGSSGSRMVLLNQAGDILSRSETDGTNHWQIGVEATVTKIAQLLKQCKENAGISNTEIECLGLGLSGVATLSDNPELEIALNKSKLAKCYYACNDTMSTLATATDAGGIVLISGTGSNCLLVEEDGKTFQCGGWGHMLGDEGSAYYISRTAMKIVVDQHEQLVPSPRPTEFVFRTMQDHFHIKEREEMLKYLYRDFDKSKIAGMTQKLADGARNGDELCLHVFNEAGKFLGRHVRGVLRMSRHPVNQPLTIVCTGGVFKSFDLLKSGFLEGILPAYDGDVNILGIKLIQLKDTAAIGAAYLAAKSCNLSVVHHYDALTNVFFSENC